MTAAPLPCGWTPDPARTALHRLADAETSYETAIRAAHGDPDLTGAAERALTAELDAIEAWADEALTVVTPAPTPPARPGDTRTPTNTGGTQ